MSPDNPENIQRERERERESRKRREKLSSERHQQGAVFVSICWGSGLTRRLTFTQHVSLGDPGTML